MLGNQVSVGQKVRSTNVGRLNRRTLRAGQSPVSGGYACAVLSVIYIHGVFTTLQHPGNSLQATK